MHSQAYEWVRAHASDLPVRVLDIGGRNINGTVRDCFPNAAEYTVLDRMPGKTPEEVDIVADAAVWDPGARTWDVVVCAEVFEHAQRWPMIAATAFDALVGGGRFIVTAAAPGRAPHSAYDGAQVRPDEWYANIDPNELRATLDQVGFADVVIDVAGTDVRAVAAKPTGVPAEDAA